MTRSFPFFATLLTITICIVLLSLGGWQIKRLAWKEGLLNDLAALRAQAQAPLSTYDDLKHFAATAGRYNFKRVTLRGHFDHGRSILLVPRTYEGKSGAHLYTPLDLDGSGTILVNRGFLPLSLLEEAARPDTVQGGIVQVTGLLLIPERPSAFVPENRPEQDEWYRLDLSQIAKFKSIKNLVPVVLYTESETPSPQSLNREALVWRPPNNHRGYALFWFSMVPVLLVIYYVRFWYKSKEHKQKEEER